MNHTYHCDCAVTIRTTSYEQEDLLRQAVQYNCGEGCALVWGQVDPKMQNDYLFMATRLGHADVLKAMLNIIPSLDPHMQALAMTNASESGSVECVSLLIDAGINPAADSSEALWCAVQKGHAPVVELLLPYCPPQDYPYAACVAALRNHQHCLQVLLPHVDLEECLTLARSMDEEGTYMWKQAVHTMQALATHKELTQEVVHQAPSSPAKKM